MNPLETVTWICGAKGCGKRFMQKDWAEACCICTVCKKPKGHAMGNPECDECRRKIWDKRAHERYTNAKLVPYKTGMVLHVDGDRFFYDDDGIFCCLQDDYDCLEDCLEDFPEYFLVATKFSGVELDMTAIVHDYVECNHHEDAVEQIEFLGPLQRYVDIWSQRQDIVSWTGTAAEKVSVVDLIKELKMEFEFEEPSA